MSEKKKIAFHTLGCKLNFSETSAISRKSDEEGYINVGFDQVADIYVINSCSVTKRAEKRCKTLVKKVLKTNPHAQIAVVGCYSQINPDEIKSISGVDLVLGNTDKFSLFEHLKPVDPSNNKENALELTATQPEVFIPSYSIDDRTRSFFKIQDGCDYFCSYCTVPLARGRSRSNSIAQTLTTATEIAKTNIKEVVLSGVNIGDFGRKNGESLYGFLQEFVKIDGIERIRISSVEPDLLHDDIIELVAQSAKLMPHFHIPLQSGSDEVLKAMGRRYDTQLFRSRVAKIKQLMPQACIAVDIIAGFPSETDALFYKSLEFLRDTPISYIHVFTYSERENTLANKYSLQIPPAERNRRSKLIQELSDMKRGVFYNSNIGFNTEVLWEKDNLDGLMHGFTSNYIKVKRKFDIQRVNTIERIRLETIDSDGLFMVK